MSVMLGGTLALYKLLVHVNPTTVAITFLLLILLLAANWGLRFAVVSSIAASLCFNFFFLPPIGTFTISDSQNWIALLVFLATALIASNLSNRIKEEAESRIAGEEGSSCSMTSASGCCSRRARRTCSSPFLKASSPRSAPREPRFTFPRAIGFTFQIPRACRWVWMPCGKRCMAALPDCVGGGRR